MNTSTFSERLRHLLTEEAVVPKKKDGTLNVAQTAKLLGIEQPTLQRMLAGQSDLPNRSNAEKLMRLLNVSFGQLVGTEILPDRATRDVLNPPAGTKLLTQEVGVSWKNRSSREDQRAELQTMLEAMPTKEIKALIPKLLELLDPVDRVDVLSKTLLTLRDAVSPDRT
ncbi:MAG: hypothetical protein AAFY29_22875 [Pseudomonadota bacterium]